MSIDDVLDYADTQMEAALTRLMDLLRLESISTDPAYKPACRAAAEWLVADLARMGVDARLGETPGHPMVVGQDHSAGADTPHLLIYGHYDVQPVDPLALWETPPFEPVILEGPNGKEIRARGASDDKGQLMILVEACRAYKAVRGSLPVRVTFFFEGEEESGSPSLIPFLKAHKSELSADLALICDTGMLTRDTPAIMTSLRGMLKEEITIHAADRDLHSGMYGGAARNPIHVLTAALAGLHDAEGRVTLPGFYDGISPVAPEILASWAASDFDAEAFLAEVGLSHPAGEAGKTLLEQIWRRPTLEVNGIWGGYTGAGFKTVLPAEAHAKISFRLVAGQDPEAIHRAFVAYMEAALPPDCRISFDPETEGSAAVEIAEGDARFEAARQALSEEWPNEAVYIGCGGSIPVAGYFQSMLDTEPLLLGFAQDNDRIHSPNEKYDLRSFHHGIRSWIRVLDALAKAS